MSKVIDYLKNLAKMSKENGICASQKAVEKLKEKIAFAEQLMAQNNKDNPLYLAQTEERLLGISLSSKRIESCDLSEVSHKCKDFYTARPNGRLILGVDILEVRESLTFKGPSQGRKRADLIICDDTAKLKCKIWAEEYELYSSLCCEKNSVIITGKRGFKNYEDFFIVEKMDQAH